MTDRIDQEATAEELVEGAARVRNGDVTGSTSGVSSRPPLSVRKVLVAFSLFHFVATVDWESVQTICMSTENL